MLDQEHQKVIEIFFSNGKNRKTRKNYMQSNLQNSYLYKKNYSKRQNKEIYCFSFARKKT